MEPQHSNHEFFILDDLIDADASGERVIASLRPGDEFWYHRKMHTIERIQVMPDRKTMRVRTDHGEYLLHGMLMFPAILTDEHAQEEQNGMRLRQETYW